MSLPCDGEDLEHTTLSCDKEFGLDSLEDKNSSFLLLERPILSASERAILGARVQVGVANDIEAHNGVVRDDDDDIVSVGNPNITVEELIAESQARHQSLKELFAKYVDPVTKEPIKAVYPIKLCNDKSGKQIYTHNDYWQGATWADEPDGNKFKPMVQACPYTQVVNGESSASVKVSLAYSIPIVGDEAVDIDFVPKKKTTPKRSQKSKQEKMAAFMAKQKGGP